MLHWASARGRRGNIRWQKEAVVAVAVVAWLWSGGSSPTADAANKTLVRRAAPEEKPRVIPLSASDSGYSENSSVTLLCTVSQGHHPSLTFDWFKDAKPLINVADKMDEWSDFGSPAQIEKHQDHSLLRIARVRPHHSGRYTCTVKNQFGQDSSSVNLIVNVRLQWIKEPPKEVVVSLNQELKVDCVAHGEPKPTMRWEKLDTVSGGFPGPRSSSFGKLAASAKEPNGYKLSALQIGGGASLASSSRGQLNIGKARESDAGYYECIASNQHDADLRKLVHVQVRGPPKILPIATADSYPEGSSINLICTVSGGQRLGLELFWSLNGEQLEEKRLRYSEATDNVSINEDDADISILRIRNATNKNSGQYTCTAKNPLGQDSTSVNIVINVELKWAKAPKDVEVGLGQEVNVECSALGSPAPTIDWIRHSSEKHHASNSNGTTFLARGRFLKIAKAKHSDSGLYECVAKNGVDQDLRRIIQVKVRGKFCCQLKS